MNPIRLTFQASGWDSDNPWNNSTDVDTTFAVERTGQRIELDGLRQYTLTVFEIGEEYVRLHIDVSAPEGQPAAAPECWDASVWRLQKESRSLRFEQLRRGERKPVWHEARICLFWDLSDEDPMLLAEEAVAKGLWREALEFGHRVDKQGPKAPSRPRAMRLQYNIARCAEKEVKPEDLEPDFDFREPYCLTVMKELVGEMNLGDEIREEVLRTYVRYLRMGMDGYDADSEADHYEQSINYMDRLRVVGYEGETDSEGRPHGQGTQYLQEEGGDEDRCKYEGHFEHGLRQGEGALFREAAFRNSLTESEYYMQGDYDAAGRQISAPPAGSYEPYHSGWSQLYSGYWEADKPHYQEPKE